jgi:4-amino-4-deoxy-L-arabinose transferase-like glycosyltransferase
MAEAVPSGFVNKILEKIDWKIVVFFAVIVAAIILRVYHFSDWLFFKMDQARDAATIKQAYNLGPGYLPLLGPKAGGTNLNLGPFFYYFQYLAVVVFHSIQPAVLAYPDLFFSILAIPLFFLFLKKYFNRDWSLILASAYALCFLAIEYSRFAWNPNSLPFFNLLYFYSLLNVFDGKIKHKYRWVILAGFSFAVSTQLHFLSFLTLPTVTLVFLIFNRKAFSKFLDWKKIILFIGIILLIYMPVFANELRTHFQDSKEFVSAIHSKASNHGLFENITRNLIYFGQYFLLIMTSYIGKSKEPIVAVIGWIIFIIPGLYLNFILYRRETDQQRKNFLIISLVWFLVYLLSYIPISYDIRPRFFLPVIVLPFIFFGYVAQYLDERKFKILVKASFLGVALIIVMNIAGTNAWFKEIKAAQKKGTYPARTIILKARDGIVLWHLENVTNYIRKDCKAANAYYYATNEYKRPVEYLLGLKNLKGFTIDKLYLGQKDCVYSVVLTRSAKNKLSSEITDKFDIAGSQKFGALTVMKLSAKDEFVGQPLGYTNKPLPEAAVEAKRVYWKDIFGK